jgi:hypothetical protein
MDDLVARIAREIGARRDALAQLDGDAARAEFLMLDRAYSALLEIGALDPSARSRRAPRRRGRLRRGGH